MTRSSRMFRLVLVPVAVLGLAGVAQAAEWKVDASHSHVGFKVRHLVIAKVRGEFAKFDGKVTIPDDGKIEKMKISGTIDVNSIDTGNAKRDGHLKSPDFFDAKNHPKITFESKSIKKKGSDYEVVGDLTIRGTKKPVLLTMEGPSKEVKDPAGGSHRAFTLEGAINRKDFGLNWSKTVEGTGAVVGDEVELEIEIELYGKK